MRLSGSRQIQRVYAGKTRTSSGPLMIYAIPNETSHARLGLSVSRRVGTAVRRNLIKRRIREAFRLSQHESARLVERHGYDLMINVRAHEPLNVAVYRIILLEAIGSLHTTWRKKLNKTS